MKHVVLGTAGHVDHGKTTLVKALTGIDTDRLKEEKERGMTIELGFAYLDLPSGKRLSIVDVPGHERFIKHMVAGAQGIDLVAFVVAADEGIMPQTKEHLQICELLGVKKGLVVITKVDLVDEELLTLVKEEVRDFLKGTFLEGAPIVEVSAVKGWGMKELVETIERLVDEVEEKPSDGLFRLPIDRVFTIKGFGTVVTGTVLSGEVSVGDEIEILPEGIRGKVRGIQVHKEHLKQARAGQRAAINLAGIEKEHIERGDVIVHPKTLKPTSILDVEIFHLPHAPVALKNGTTLQLHIGTSHLLAQIILLETDVLEPRQRGLAQLRLQKPIVAQPFDKFILRGSGPIQTWGGGIVLDTHPPRHKRFKTEVIQKLKELRESDPQRAILYHLNKYASQGLTLKEIMAHTGLRKRVVEEALGELSKEKKVLLLENTFLPKETLDRLKTALVEILSKFHQQNPLRLGMTQEEIKGKLKTTNEGLIAFTIERLLEEDVIQKEGDFLRLKTHKIPFSEEELKELENLILRASLSPPTPKEIAQFYKKDLSTIKEILSILVHRGFIIRVKEDLYFHKEVLDSLRNKLIEYLKKHGSISIQEFKNLTGTSRKYVIPLAEYFDQIKVTIRVGDERILRGN